MSYPPNPPEGGYPVPLESWKGSSQMSKRWWMWLTVWAKFSRPQ